MLKKSSYLISRFFATTAGSLYGFAIIWWIQFNTSSSTIVGLVNAGFDLTAALSIFYGPLIDKHSFKQTALGASFLQAFWLFYFFLVCFYQIIF
ncbi:hypothetical protein [Lactobacillus helveticus]|uniref:hypothetical protein n=1 Tax=Lactobacillus helveticus TaxID=1587 RepID=UPI00386C363F